MIGQTITHYKILEKLGEGGMGVVYKAEDTKLKRTVALKFIPAELTRDPQARERFIHEAQAASALQQSNICTVHDIDQTADGQMFIVMDLYEGETLKKKIERGPLPIDEAINIVSQIARGLARAHEAGIIHRDIKPANIIVTTHDEVKIVDFGLAKLSGRTLLTKSGMTLGTAAYMSPEQARGEHVDFRSDIWSLGVVFYEMLTGKRPFASEYEQALVYSILNEEPKPIRHLRPDVPEAIEKICRRAVAKDVKDRYQTATELITDLESYRTGTRLSQKTEKVVSRKRKVTYTGAVLILIAIAIVGIFRATERKEPGLLEKKMLIVLPFENQGVTSDDYFAEGLTGEITSRLGIVNALGVISHTTAEQYKTTTKKAREIGRECGVDYVLEGAVRWDHAAPGMSRVRINLELIRAEDDVQIWANGYERPMEDVFGVQTQITEEIVKELDLKIAEPERKRLLARPTNNQEAFDLYLQAQMHDNIGRKTDREDEYKQEIRCLEKSISLDPKFALGYASLSKVHSWQYFDIDRIEKHLTLSKEFLDKAFLLEPDAPYAHEAAAYYYYHGFRDYDHALQELDAVKRSLPNYHDPTYGYILRRQGKFEQSIRVLEEAFKYDPRNWQLTGEIGNTYLYQRSYDQAIEWLDRALSMDPDNGWLRGRKWAALMYGKGDTAAAKLFLETWNWSDARGLWRLILKLERNYTEALRTLDSVKWFYEENQEYATSKDLVLATYYSLLGDSMSMKRHADAARELFEDSLRHRPSDFRLHAALGYAYAYLGEKNLAVEHGKYATQLMPISEDAMMGPTYVEDLAEVYAIIGNKEESIKQLEYLQSIPYGVSIAYFRLDPVWDSLRDYPRFKKLVGEKMGK